MNKQHCPFTHIDIIFKSQRVKKYNYVLRTHFDNLSDKMANSNLKLKIIYLSAPKEVSHL